MSKKCAKECQAPTSFLLIIQPGAQDSIQGREPLYQRNIITRGR